MLKLSTLLLGAGLVIGSAVLAGLWQAKGPRVSSTTRRPAPAAVDVPVEPAIDKGQSAVRSVYPGLVAGAPPPRGLDERASASRRDAAPSAPADPKILPNPALPPPGPNLTPEIAAADPSPGPPPGAGEPSPESGSVDLNSGSVEDLNRLGAGMIGRRIIGGRPYASPEDLVTRRVLTRKDFDRIKTQIVVQTSPAAPQ